MTSCAFPLLVFIVILLDAVYFAWFICKPNWRHTTPESCKMYVEVAKGLILSAGVVTAVLQAHSSQVHRSRTALQVLRFCFLP